MEIRMFRRKAPKNILILLLATTFVCFHCGLKVARMRHCTRYGFSNRVREVLDYRILTRSKNQSSHLERITEDLRNKSRRYTARNEPVLVSAALKENLGNYLFMVASLMGISRKNDMVPVTRSRRRDYAVALKGLRLIPVMKDLSLMRHFNRRSTGRLKMFVENGTERFSPGAFDIRKTFKFKSTFLWKFLQSWKYFDFMRDEIRALLGINKNLLVQASKIIVQEVSQLKNTDPCPEQNIQLVGIHVRRGDLLTQKNQNLGYYVASDEYLLRTIDLTKKSSAITIFIVVSNDLAYCRTLMNGSNFIFFDGHSRLMDMAVLTLMDRLILTVGTFGWWSAYLSDATTVFYYKRPFRRNSKLSAILEPDDFFYPAWYGGS